MAQDMDLGSETIDCGIGTIRYSADILSIQLMMEDLGKLIQSTSVNHVAELFQRELKK